MKNREQKQKDLDALVEQFRQANAAMLVSFKNMTVAKDQELRRQLRVVEKRRLRGEQQRHEHQQLFHARKTCCGGSV